MQKSGYRKQPEKTSAENNPKKQPEKTTQKNNYRKQPKKTTLKTLPEKTKAGAKNNPENKCRKQITNKLKK